MWRPRQTEGWLEATAWKLSVRDDSRRQTFDIVSGPAGRFQAFRPPAPPSVGDWIVDGTGAEPDILNDHQVFSTKSEVIHAVSNLCVANHLSGEGQCVGGISHWSLSFRERSWSIHRENASVALAPAVLEMRLVRRGADER